MPQDEEPKRFFALTRWLRRGRSPADPPERPWLLRPAWATPEVRCGARKAMWLAWAGVIIWNLIAMPTGYFTAIEFTQGNTQAAIGLLFPLVGIGLMAWCVKETLAWQRFGPAHFAMDPHPGAIGGQVGGTIDVNLPYDEQVRYKTALCCLYSYVSGSGKNRKRRERLVWQSEGVAHTRSHAAGTRLEILFDVDEDLPASDPEQGRGTYHLWRLQVSADVPGIDFDRTFELPVFPTGERSRSLHALNTDHPLAVEARADAIGRILAVTRIPGGVELYYPPFKHPGVKVTGLVLGSVLTGVGWLVGDMPFLMRMLFGAVGILSVLWSAYALLSSLRVRIDDTGLEIRRFLLGVPARVTTISREDIRALTLKQSYSASSGHEHTVYYKLLALTLDDKKVAIGHNFAGRETAMQALDALSGLTGIAVIHRDSLEST